MDIKLKSIKYSFWAKVAAFIIVWLCVMSAVGSALFLLYNHNTVNSKSYYDTHQFKNEFSTLVSDAVEYNVKLKSEANIKSSGDEKEIINKNLQRYYFIKKKLTESVNFAYYLKNTSTGEAVTNIKSGDALALIQKQPSDVYYNQGTFESNFLISTDIMQMLEGTQYEVYAAVIEPLKPGDVFYDDFMSYSEIKALSNNVTILLIASIILTILAFIYLVMVTGRREPGGEINLSFIDRLYTDVYTMVVFFAALISIAIVAQISYLFPVELIVMALIFGIDVLIGLSYVLSMIRQIKCGQLFRNTLIYKILDLCFNGKTFKSWALLLLLGYGLVNGILFAITAASGDGGFFIFLFLIIPFNVAAIYFAAKALLSLSQIMEAVKEISAGNLDYALDNSKISVAFADFTKDIQSIQGGLKTAVAEAVKGERMKTDLIANVSHDLKTPLTSVINYVDLLKQEDLDNEKANQYLCILEEKSARLKQLIEDLIEASKASSGNLAVSAEKVDLHELVMQACGEYEEKIKKAELDVHISADKTLISADGKHMWRIVENLLSNVVKYSLPHTRVYINVAESHPYGVLIVKNISANPLDIPPEQLTERFVRGDVSRTTEGSGLGLSIAQSLTNIQGGRFKIEIDGDLFKVTVEMPLWEKQ
ncbi:sensor histidine kinase [Desulfoscipio gibsoniae]|uniref:histidine kinase n=1 Tax=Desulfoscipio gibsoniae DSM 7213 TaxID=767817 RepID=R4KIC7_9FIRM|nr:HAMP domain-containing sensor histidine kinase [Desulfoscipio gibsoniae]AGL00285.1 signal transduction histidine kinase [Desulfoscipio gibsoniae DSM 7213]